MSSNYAIIETGSKQYRVEPNSIIDVELLDVPEKRKTVSLDKVLLFRDGEKVHVGTPVLKGVTVTCDYLGEVRAKKVVAFKFRRRKDSKSIHGHRQDYTRLKVKEIKIAK